MLVNYDVIENFVVNELDKEKEIVNKLLSFLKTYTDEISKLDLSADKSDTKFIIHIAHKCRSLSRSFGCESLYQLLLEAENFGRDQDMQKMFIAIAKAKDIAIPSYCEVEQFVKDKLENR